MKEEIWKAVDGYEGLYEVSNFGRVKGVDRVIINSDGVKRLWKGRVLRPAKGSNGYFFCNLCKNGKTENKCIHRLVAETFIPNPSNLPQVNHKDENKENNCVDNLEWCDSKYNNNYGSRNKRDAEKKLNSPKLSKPVLQIDNEKGVIISEYPSTMEAERQLNIYSSAISKCCRGERKTAYGYKWRYK